MRISVTAPSTASAIVRPLIEHINASILRSELARVATRLAPGRRIVLNDFPHQYPLVVTLGEALSVYLAIDDRTVTVWGAPAALHSTLQRAWRSRLPTSCGSVAISSRLDNADLGFLELTGRIGGLTAVWPSAGAALAPGRSSGPIGAHGAKCRSERSVLSGILSASIFVKSTELRLPVR